MRAGSYADQSIVLSFLLLHCVRYQTEPHVDVKLQLIATREQDLKMLHLLDQARNSISPNKEPQGIRKEKLPLRPWMLIKCYHRSRCLNLVLWCLIVSQSKLLSSRNIAAVVFFFVNSLVERQQAPQL